ncbi:hypothetical protein D3C80_1840000 [compost metagenome]
MISGNHAKNKEAAVKIKNTIIPFVGKFNFCLSLNSFKLILEININISNREIPNKAI